MNDAPFIPAHWDTVAQDELRRLGHPKSHFAPKIKLQPLRAASPNMVEMDQVETELKTVINQIAFEATRDKVRLLIEDTRVILAPWSEEDKPTTWRVAVKAWGLVADE